MASSEKVLLGFDPGGKGKFGWSICISQSTDELPKIADCGVGDDAKDVLDQVTGILRTEMYGAEVLAAGIDAPLFWGEKGNRAIDQLIQVHLNKADQARVLKINSLFGACTVQGVILGKYLREKFEQIRITETHPSALLGLLKNRLPEEHRILGDMVGYFRNDHVRDATISAFCAWQMLRNPIGWNDITQKEPRPVQPLGTLIEYWMPLPLAE